MSVLFIAGTGTDIGKTYVAAALIRALRAAGRKAEAFKPVVSGFDPAAPAGSDPAVLIEALGETVTPGSLAHMSPLQFLAPLAPPMAALREGRTLEAETVLAHCRRRIIEAGEALLLIEGAGGIMSPIAEDATVLDIVEALAVPVLLVGGTYLGSISHTLTAVEVLKARGLTTPAIVLSQSPAPSPDAEETRLAVAKASGISTFVIPRNGGFEAPDLQSGRNPAATNNHSRELLYIFR